MGRRGKGEGIHKNGETETVRERGGMAGGDPKERDRGGSGEMGEVGDKKDKEYRREGQDVERDRTLGGKERN